MAPKIFFHTFRMALYHKWGVKTGFTFALQFFILISDILAGVGLNDLPKCGGKFAPPIPFTL